MPPPWGTTPAEFEDLVEGGAEAVRQDAFNAAMVTSAVYGLGGVKLPPQAFIDPDYEYGETPLAASTDEAASSTHAKYLAEVRRKADEAHREWLEAMDLGPER